MKISNHRIDAVRHVSSPNMGGALDPVGIVLHDTGALSAQGSISWLSNPVSKVSAHVVVARDGSVTQLVPFNRQAWHAGKSSWQGRSNVNGFAVGIEISNPGRLRRLDDDTYVNDMGVKVTAKDGVVEPRTTPEHGAGFWLRYSPEQIETVAQICLALREAYPRIGWIATHWLISPGRKVDTNPLFPLDQLRNRVFGVAAGRVVSVVTPAGGAGSDEAGDSIRAIQRRLKALGYYADGNVDGLFGTRSRDAVMAFQADNELNVTGKLDAATISALREDRPRPVAPARLMATEEVIKSRPAVAKSRVAERLVKWGIIGSGAVGSASEVGLLDQAEQMSSFGHRIGTLVSDWWPMVKPFWPLALVGVGIVLVIHLRSIRKAELAAYRAGEISS